MADERAAARLRPVLVVGALALAAVAAAAVAVLTHSSSSPTSSPTSSASAAAHAVMHTYWHDIAAGDYRAAFLQFDGSEQNRVHGQQWFVNDKARDAPIRVRVQFGAAAVKGQFATVPIVLLETIGSRTGCHRWTGSYRLRHIGSRWLIDAANIHKHSC